METILIALVSLAVGGGGAFAYTKVQSAQKGAKADKILANAQNKASDIILKATETAKKEADELRRDLKKSEDKVAEREHAIVSKIEELDKRAEKIRASESDIDKLKDEVRDIRDKQQEKLEKIAKLSKKEAAEKLMAMTERDVKGDLTGLVTKLQREAEDTAEEKAQMVILTAMERMASDVTSERTVTAVELSDEDMKGRIIGKEGRNIQALQRATGVDILVDDTPGMIILSSFDPVRRQTARLALEMLMKDGRIHPARIEEVVEKAGNVARIGFADGSCLWIG